jgi:hypothetical protein
MAFGQHWEWRGFGSLSPAVRERIEALPRKFAGAQEVADRYLWVPSSRLNVKLRFGAFKVKRCLERSPGGIESWLEDERENYSFPLPGPVLAEVLSAFGHEPSNSLPPSVSSEAELLSLLRGAARSVRVVEVQKRRWQYDGPPSGRVIVELAEIHSPERTTSVGIEDEEREQVVASMAHLGLPDRQRSLSYVDALELWGRGAQIGAST